jgi:hypothetical protein
MDRRRIAKVLSLVAVLAVALLVGTRLKWPKDQTVHYVLGDAAARVEEVDARWGEGDKAGVEDWTREATFRYARGLAPRVVTHEPRLPDGDYTVQIEILASRERNVVTKRVHLTGGVTSIELAPSVPR